jgi:hypothetical protein
VNRIAPRPEPVSELHLHVYASVHGVYRVRLSESPAPAEPPPFVSRSWYLRFRTIVARDGPSCHLCELPLANGEKVVQDHLRPKSAGGPDGPGNRGLAHAPCDRLRRSADVVIAAAYVREWRSGTLTFAAAERALTRVQPTPKRGIPWPERSAPAAVARPGAVAALHMHGGAAPDGSAKWA